MLLNASISKNRSSFQVPAAKLTKDAFWTKVDEERLASESLMEKLVDKFGTKPVPKSVTDMNGDGANGGIGGKKKGKELRVLDQKVIQFVANYYIMGVNLFWIFWIALGC